MLQVISTFGAGKMFYVAKLHPNEDKQNMLFGGCGDKKIYQFDVDTGDAVQVLLNETVQHSACAELRRSAEAIGNEADRGFATRLCPELG